MVRYAEVFRGLRETALARIRSKGGIAVILSSVVLWVLLVYAGDWTKASLNDFGNRVSLWAHSPVGYAGLALAAWIGFWCAFLVVVVCRQIWTNAPTQHVAEIARLQAETTKLQDRATKTAAALIEAEAGRDNGKKDARHYSALFNYGRELPDYYRLEDPDHRIMNSRVHEIQARLKPCLAEIEAVWVTLRGVANGQGDTSAVYGLADRMDTTEHANLLRVSKSLANTLENQEDSRPYLTLTYVLYREWRGCLLQFGGLLQESAETSSPIPEYNKWTQAEIRFLDELHTRLAIPQLGAVRKSIEQYDKENGPLTPLVSPSGQSINPGPLGFPP
jgi:hypothetical protein